MGRACGRMGHQEIASTHQVHSLWWGWNTDPRWEGNARKVEKARMLATVCPCEEVRFCPLRELVKLLDPRVA